MQHGEKAARVSQRGKSKINIETKGEGHKRYLNYKKYVPQDKRHIELFHAVIVQN